MKILSLDTSICGDLLTLFDHSKVIFHKAFGKNQRSSHVLMQNIKETLDSYGIELSDLEAIAVGLGPGSFLGTRVGVIIAKTLTYALDIQLIGFCSLSLYSSKSDGIFYSLSDAKSKGIYSLKGEKKGTELRFEKTPQLIAPDQFDSFKEGAPLVTADQALFEKASSLHLPIKAAELKLESHFDFLKQSLKPSTSYDPSANIDIHYLRLS